MAGILSELSSSLLWTEGRPTYEKGKSEKEETGSAANSGFKSSTEECLQVLKLTIVVSEFLSDFDVSESEETNLEFGSTDLIGSAKQPTFNETIRSEERE